MDAQTVELDRPIMNVAVAGPIGASREHIHVMHPNDWNPPITASLARNFTKNDRTSAMPQ
jgi:hypothetical protein